jgi:DNA polymerase-3 subunit epsilon
MTRRGSWREARLVAVDIETTGLDPRSDRVISFGAVPIEAGRIVAGASVYGLVNPERDLPAESIVIHGIREQDLRDAPSAPEALRPLADALRGAEVVAHAEWVERGFLSKPLRGLGVRLPRTLIDTAQLYRLWEVEQHRPDPHLRALSAIADDLGLPIHRPHHALGDALTTAQVFLALATHLEHIGRDTVRKLRSAEKLMQTRTRYLQDD